MEMDLLKEYNHAIILSLPEEYDDSIVKELDEFYDGPERPNDKKCGCNNSTGELESHRFNESNYDKEEVTKYYSCMSSIEDLNKTDNNSASYIEFRTSTPIESSNLQSMFGVDKFGSMSTIYQNFTSSDIPLRESDFEFTEESYSAKEHCTSPSLESNLQNLQEKIEDKDNLAAKIPSWVFSNTDTPLQESDFQNYDDSYIEKKHQDKKRTSTPTEFCWENLQPLFENNDNEAMPTTGDNFSDDDFPLSRSEYDSHDSFMERERQALMSIIGRAFSNPPNHNNEWSNNFNEGHWSTNRNTDEWYKDNEYCSKPLTLF